MTIINKGVCCEARTSERDLGAQHTNPLDYRRCSCCQHYLMNLITTLQSIEFFFSRWHSHRWIFWSRINKYSNIDHPDESIEITRLWNSSNIWFPISMHILFDAIYMGNPLSTMWINLKNLNNINNYGIIIGSLIPFPDTFRNMQVFKLWQRRSTHHWNGLFIVERSLLRCTPPAFFVCLFML